MQVDIIDAGWDQIIARAAKSKQSELRIVCPFIKHRAVKRMIDGNHAPGIRVITRFNLRDFYSGVSDTDALRWLLGQGAEIRGVKGLHAKMYLFGLRQVIVTSANLTEAALLRNHEFGFTSRDADVVQRCREYFDALWEQAGNNLTERQLAGWERQLKRAVVTPAASSVDSALPDEGTDITGTVALLTQPAIISEAETGFVKFFGEATNRESPDFATIEELKRGGCHWACPYPADKRPRSVRDGDLMFMGRLSDDYDTFIFGRAVALAYVDGRDDASAADIARRSWKDYWRHYIRVHHGEFVSGPLRNGIRLSELMDALGANAFASTQRNAASGRGNMNPRRAYRQQAAVKLSREGLNWLNDRLEQSFRDHGKVTPAELASLDWPTTAVAHIAEYKRWSISHEGRKTNTADEYVRFLQRCADHYGEAIDDHTVRNEAVANEMIDRVMKVVKARGRWENGTFNEKDVTQNLTPALRAYGRFVEANF